MTSQVERRSAFSPAEFLGRASIGPLSESEEEEDERRPADGGQKIVFERDCTELDLNLIEENWSLLGALSVITASISMLSTPADLYFFRFNIMCSSGSWWKPAALYTNVQSLKVRSKDPMWEANIQWHCCNHNTWACSLFKIAQILLALACWSTP